MVVILVFLQIIWFVYEFSFILYRKSNRKKVTECDSIFDFVILFLQNRSSWSMSLRDSAQLIDDVTYDPSTWITTFDGYSYELISKGFDNDLGDNWAMSCSVLGTPGSDPSADCDAECKMEDNCGGGGSCNVETLICDCDEGYYPQCTSATSCTTCLEVPAIDECSVYWVKNGTDRFAYFQWTNVDRDGSTQYKLNYFAGSKSGALSDVLTFDVFHSTPG